MRVIDPWTQVELWVPIFATPDRAIRREARRREGTLRSILLCPELGVEWPVSDSETLEIETFIAELSSGLRWDLQRWNSTWLNGYHYFLGWASAHASDTWRFEGACLTRRLQQEAWDFAEVVAGYEMYSRSRTPEESRSGRP